MPALKNILLSVLLLTVAARAEENTTTTVTLFDVGFGPDDTGLKVVDVSASRVESNGGTVYLQKEEITITSGGTPVTATQTWTMVEAASWLYVSITSAGVNLVENCTVETNGSTAKCVEVVNVSKSGVGTFTTTTTAVGQVFPLYTLTATPTASNAAKILDNSMFNRFPRFLVGIFFILMFF